MAKAQEVMVYRVFRRDNKRNVIVGTGEKMGSLGRVPIAAEFEIKPGKKYKLTKKYIMYNKKRHYYVSKK